MKVPFKQMLQWYRERPRFLSGRPSLHDLWIFLLGYSQALSALEVPPPEELVRFQQFDPWLHERFHDRSTRSWAQLLLERYADDGTALEQFWSLLDIFRAEQETRQSG